MTTKHTLPAPGVARWALALLAVPALLAGILAMHFITDLSATGDQVDLSSAAIPAAATAATTLVHEPASPLVADGCLTQCSPAHEMIAMACLLLLLLVPLLFLGSTRGRWAWLFPRAQSATIKSALATLAVPQSVSLTSLSISRT